MEFPKLSVYRPLSRFFTDERGREIEEARRLYDWVKARQDAFAETPITIGARVYEHFEHLPYDTREPLATALDALITAEPIIWDLPPPDFERMSLQEFVEYRNLLLAKQYFFMNQAAILDAQHDALTVAIAGIAVDMPATETPSPFTIPLIYTLPNPHETMQRIFNALGDPADQDRGIFRLIGSLMWRNLCEVSGRNPTDTKSTKPLKHVEDSTLPLAATVDQYFASTPFRALFLSPVPLKLTHEDRFSHMHVVGGTGAGKTTLIENLILHDLRSDDPPSLVLIDPHGDLIKKLIHADLGIEDRLIIIDPRDVKHPPAVNVFAQNRERHASYDEATREQITAGVIQTFDYLFTGLIGADLTAKQGVFFRYITRLMLMLPEALGRNATILDIMQLMQDPAPYAKAIELLPDIPREFFLKDFTSKTFVQTREQIRYRLQAIIENPTLARLFTSTETKIDLFTEMNRGAIILVDTAKDFLKSGSASFGKIFISLVLQAVLERSAIPAAQRKPTFLIVDECADAFDSNIDDLLTEARKYKCGLVLAHQYLDQASSSLRASLAANTGTKFASGLSASDARAMAPEMRTTPDFILSQPKLQFAAHIRNVTPQAVSIPVEAGSFDKLDQLSEEAFASLMERNRARVSLTKALPQRSTYREPVEPEGPMPSPQQDDDEILREW